jgi:hypothetical protein
MKTDYKLLTVLLGVLGVLDLAAVPFMIAANHHTAGAPPVPAIIVTAVIGVATLVSAVGVARGLQWAFRVAVTCRVIDAASNFLGLTNHPTAVTTIGGGVGLVLSLVALVLLVRLNPRRIARREASAAKAASGSRGGQARVHAVTETAAGLAEQTPPVASHRQARRRCSGGVVLAALFWLRAVVSMP